jgi:hypothetical protein
VASTSFAGTRSRSGPSKTIFGSWWISSRSTFARNWGCPHRGLVLVLTALARRRICLPRSGRSGAVGIFPRYTMTFKPPRFNELAMDEAATRKHIKNTTPAQWVAAFNIDLQILNKTPQTHEANSMVVDVVLATDAQKKNTVVTALSG